MTFAEQAEAAGRELLAAQLPPERMKRKFRYRQRLTGKVSGLLTINQAGIFSFRPRYARRPYEVDVASVAALVVQRLAMAQAAKTRAERKAKRQAPRTR